eukprot:SAG22_NODE_1029_length_5939_cov_46.559589_3_plen_94_part_00
MSRARPIETHLWVDVVVVDVGCDRIGAGEQAVQGNPAQAGQFSLTQKENFPSAPAPVATGTIDGADSFARRHRRSFTFHKVNLNPRRRSDNIF